MATMTKRKVKGHMYYYLVDGKRVDGKSRLVKQQYLGRADQGGGQALFQIARSLRLVDFIDAVAPKRDQGRATGRS